MISNNEMLEYCLNNPDNVIDKYYEGLLERKIIPEDSRTKNSLTEANKQMIDLFTTIQTLNNMGDFSKDDEIVKKINEILKTTENINYSPFIQYLMIHNINYGIYLNLSFSEQKMFIKEYIKDRHSMYLSHGYSNIVYQVLSDNYSHKRKADLGTKKIRTQVEALGIKHYNEENKDGTYYISPDKGDTKLFEELIKKYKIDYPYYNIKNGKLPDLFLKIDKKFVIVEHKNMKQGGGHQNNVMVEVKDFVNETSDNRVYFVSYMDGIYFKSIFQDAIKEETFEGKNKTERTINNIRNIFEKNPNSYFVNTKGFEKLISELLIK